MSSSVHQCVDIQERRLQSTMNIAICHQNNNWNWCWVISFNFRDLDMSNYVINKDQPRPVYNLIAVSVSSMAFLISRFRNSTENGYKLCVQWFLGLFGRTNVSYDWSVVVKATTQAIPEIIAPKACTLVISGVGNNFQWLFVFFFWLCWRENKALCIV